MPTTAALIVTGKSRTHKRVLAVQPRMLLDAAFAASPEVPSHAHRGTYRCQGSRVRSRPGHSADAPFQQRAAAGIDPFGQCPVWQAGRQVEDGGAKVR